MRVHVVETQCQGHGRCYDLAPDLFEPDEIGNSHETNEGLVPDGAEQLAQRAVLNCPERAIKIVED